MIIESLCDFFVSFLLLAVDTVGGVISLPVNLVQVLSTITSYGAYFVGDDLLLIFSSTILFWSTAKMGVGLFVFIWKLLPLT